jgi:hypothetical protein
MKIVTYSVAAAALAACLGGCATVTRGTTTNFTVNSTPPGAAVKTSTGFTCEATPCSMKMPRKTAFDVTVSKAGYVTKTQHVRSEVSGGGAAGLAGNVVAGGVLGMVVDGTSGAMDDLIPNPMSVTLDPEAAPAAQAPASDPAPAAKP